MKDITLNINYKVCTFDELSEDQKKVVKVAKEATKHSYCPYSHFHVGAGVELENKEIYQGSNQENAAYGPTSCAERTALFYIHHKCPEVDIKRICCISCNDAQEFSESVCTPCGVCRQVIFEFEAMNPHHSDIEVICGGRDEYYIFKSIKDLLPFGFGPSNLTKIE